MIEVIFDVHGLEDKATALVLADPRYYPEIRLRLRQAAATGSNLRVVVTNPGMAGWFSDLSRDDRVRLERRDAVKELQQALCTTTLPDFLIANPSLIGQWGLLNDANNKPRSQDVSDWILSRSLGWLWGKSRLNAEEVSELVGWLAESKMSTLDNSLKELASRKFDSWVIDPGLEDLLTWLKGNPEAYSRLFAVAQRLTNYPLGQVMGWLGATSWAELAALDRWRQIAKQVPTVKLASSAIPSGLNVSVRAYLLSRVGQDPAKLAEAAGEISGLLPGEIAALEKLLEGWTAPVSRRVVETLRSKLGNHSVVDSLEELVPPAPPPGLPAGSATAVLEWVRSEYVPYYRWTRRTKQEGLTEPLALQFEQWFSQNASGLSQKLDLTALGVTDHASRVAQDGVLVVIVDGLGAEWADELTDLLRAQGLSPVLPTQTRFTVAPTITAYAKPAMIRGVRPVSLPDKSWNTAAYETLLAERYTDRPVHAISDLDPTRKLRNLVTAAEDGKGYFLYLANGLDERLHQSMSEQKRRQEASAYLAGICASLREACEYYSTSFGKALPVVITGDHGHCVLPATARNMGVPQFGSLTHGRVIELDEEPADVPDGAILLKPDVWGLKRPLLVASGYSYWGAKPGGGVHGGLMPEEVVTPVLTVQLGGVIEKQVEYLVLGIVGEIRRGKSGNEAVLQIVNPNDTPAELIDLEIDGMVLRNLVLPIEITALDMVELEVAVDGRGMRKEMELLEGRCTFRCAGKSTPQMVTISVQTTGGAVDDFDMF